MTTDAFFEKVLTVRLTPDRKGVDIIDQTLLPGTVKRIVLSTREEIWEAIRKLRVRGAPAIGVCAAYALAVTSAAFETEDMDAFLTKVHEDAQYYASSRPTAVNLFWALRRMENTARSNAQMSVA